MIRECGLPKTAGGAPSRVGLRPSSDRSSLSAFGGFHVDVLRAATGPSGEIDEHRHLERRKGRSEFQRVCRAPGRPRVRFTGPPGARCARERLGRLERPIDLDRRCATFDPGCHDHRIRESRSWGRLLQLYSSRHPDRQVGQISALHSSSRPVVKFSLTTMRHHRIRASRSDRSEDRGAFFHNRLFCRWRH
jgi:hypothetical protein